MPINGQFSGERNKGQTGGNRGQKIAISEYDDGWRCARSGVAAGDGGAPWARSTRAPLLLVPSAQAHHRGAGGLREFLRGAGDGDAQLLDGV